MHAHADTCQRGARARCGQVLASAPLRQVAASAERHRGPVSAGRQAPLGDLPSVDLVTRLRGNGLSSGTPCGQAATPEDRGTIRCSRLLCLPKGSAFSYSVVQREREPYLQMRNNAWCVYLVIMIIFFLHSCGSVQSMSVTLCVPAILLVCCGEANEKGRIWRQGVGVVASRRAAMEPASFAFSGPFLLPLSGVMPLRTSLSGRFCLLRSFTFLSRPNLSSWALFLSTIVCQYNTLVVTTIIFCSPQGQILSLLFTENTGASNFCLSSL